jgi:hypothetical protein
MRIYKFQRFLQLTQINLNARNSPSAIGLTKSISYLQEPARYKQMAPDVMILWVAIMLRTWKS